MPTPTPKISIGQSLKEIIRIKLLEDEPDGWYEKFKQKLITNGYKEIEPYHWQRQFTFTLQEHLAVTTPAERTLCQAFIRAGRISTSITLELEFFRPYTLTTPELITIGKNRRVSYLHRLKPTNIISEYDEGFREGSKHRLLDVMQRMKNDDYPDDAIAEATGLTEQRVASLLANLS
ncbi:hypothetical protein ACPV3S_15965 [Photobacterium damselae]|uniref:hypothetical protein n=1 Tax=Photobacterium damselae TaxID=38293 RepID=UPI004067B8D9